MSHPHALAGPRQSGFMVYEPERPYSMDNFKVYDADMARKHEEQLKSMNNIVIMQIL